MINAGRTWGTPTHFGRQGDASTPRLPPLLMTDPVACVLTQGVRLMRQSDPVAERRRPRVPSGQEKLVIQRSGNRCAYPSCGRRLIFEATNPLDQDKVIGKVAHICAASPDGPRYDASMTDAQRGSAGNLTYLCGDHHDAIDSQISKHTVEFLLDAKKSHEAAMDRAGGYAVGEVGFTHT